MIKTIKQARAVQQRRVAAGRHGYAKAVRRFVSSDCALSCEEYYSVRNSLPALWRELKVAA